MDIAQQPTLRRTIGPFQFFALAIGVIIGSAWVVLVGDLLQLGGPGGAILGFTAGGFVMIVVAAAYGELASRIPVAGGEFIFAYRLFGRRLGFLVGWLITLYLVASTAFEAIALAAILQALIPAIRGPALYSLLGQPVTLGGVSIGALGTLLITYLNHRDVRLAVRFQAAVTYSFLAVAFGVIIAGLVQGQPTNMRPLFASPPDSSPWFGALSIFATSAYFLNGFQAVPQAIEERAEGVSARTITRVMMLSVAIAAVFLCLVVVAVSMATPWQSIVNQPMMTATALSNLKYGNALATIVLIAAAASVLKAWNALALMASRMLMAQARESLLPSWLASIHPVHKTPAIAALLVGVLTMTGVMLGRGAMLPIVDMGSLCLAATFVLCFVGVMKLRRAGIRASDGAGVPGGTWVLWLGLAGASVMAIFALAEPVLTGHRAIPVEWILLVAWSAIGAFVYRRGESRAVAQPRSVQ
jgi:basic amino acid/polyamine antiporter, APA family